MDNFEILVMLIGATLAVIASATLMVMAQTLVSLYQNQRARQQLIQHATTAIENR